MTVADFELAYGVLPEAMLLATPSGRILAANEAAAALLNRGVLELAATTISDIAARPENVARLLSLFSRNGRLMPGALTFKNGASEIVCRVAGALLPTPDSKALLLRLQPQDDAVKRFRALNDRITELNREIFDRKQVARASTLLSAIVDSSDDAIVSKDLNATIMSWNKAAERLFGYTAAEAVGQSITLIIPPDRMDEESEILARLKRGERIDHFETIRMRKDGTRLNVSLTISPVKDVDGRIVGASKIARDITARIRQEKALREANEALQRANADLEQFAYSAAHDLQEPLRMISLYSELLQQRFGGKLGAKGDEYIRFTVEGAARMESLLRNLRIYTQASTTEYGADEEADANEVLKKALLNLEVAIKESGASIISAGLPRVPLHEFQLEQIFQNLIGNAIRYRSNKPPCIHVSALLQDNEWRFSVHDNGIGIDPKFKEQIFGIFKRLHNASEYPGTGMGLAICQRIIERAGGRIWVESELGRGSTFYFTIPCPEPAADRSGAEELFDSSGRG